LLIGLVVDGEGSGETNVADAEGFYISAKNADAETVECGKRRLRECGVAENFFYALRHLLGGLVGKGDREDTVGRNATLLDEIRDAVGDNAGLAGAGAGKQKHGAIDREDSFALLGVHVGEKVGHKLHFICL